MTLAPDTRLGQYQILAPLGAGGMGEIYRARDTRLDRIVALKVLPERLASDGESRARFHREAKAVAALSHPNILAIHDFGIDDQIAYSVTELLDGEDLRERLQGAALTTRKAVEIALQIAQGLAAAHERGIVHRDLKPANVFVTKDGHVKILDFGLAKVSRPDSLTALSQAATVGPGTEPGRVLGTVGYMSPEQVRGAPVDHRTDIFSFGSLLYEMLAGRPAFRGDSAVETMNAILKEEPPVIPSVSGHEILPGLEAILRRCLEKNPGERFQSACDLAFALENFSGMASSSAIAPAAVGARRRLRRYALVGSVALGGIIVGLGLALISGGRLRPSASVSSLTYEQLSFRRGGIMGARFAPDGQGVFYTAAWDISAPEIFESRPGTNYAPRALGVTQANILAISKDGTMAVTVGAGQSPWSASGALAQVPMSGGVPRLLLDSVQAADWAPDGQTLAIVRRAAPKTQLEMPPGRVLRAYDGGLRLPRFSPDGRWLAFEECPDPTDIRGSPVITDLAGKEVARGPEYAGVTGLAWSANGREVWYTVVTTGPGQIIALTPTGRTRVVACFPVRVDLKDIGRDGRVLVARSTGQMGMRGRRSPSDAERELGWLTANAVGDVSGDGQQLLYTEHSEGGTQIYSVWLRGMDGSPAVKLGEGKALSLSPDGKWALILRMTEPRHLALIPTGVGDTLSLPRGSVEVFGVAGWLPDSKRIVFTGNEAGGKGRTFMQDIAGGLPQPLTPEGFTGTKVSPDGRFLLADGPEGIYAYPIAGGEPRRLPGLEPGETAGPWTADGRAIYVRRTAGQKFEVRRMDLTTGARTPWLTSGLPDPTCAGIFGSVLTPDGRAYAYDHVNRVDVLLLVRGLR